MGLRQQQFNDAENAIGLTHNVSGGRRWPSCHSPVLPKAHNAVLAGCGEERAGGSGEGGCIRNAETTDVNYMCRDANGVDISGWSAKDPWQKRRYPGGTLQRIRTDQHARGRVLTQIKADPEQGRPRDEWHLTPTAGSELMATEPLPQKPIRLVDLALWFGRSQDVADLDALLGWFDNQFAPRVCGDLVGTVYLDNVPQTYREVPFAATPIDEATYELLGSLPPAPTVAGTVEELVAKLELHITAGGYQLPDGLVRRVLTAWLRGDMVVLVGQPGTGKTMFADLMSRAMQEELDLDARVLIPIRADCDESEFIGYERLDGKPELRDFATEVLLTDTPLEARVVVLEEFNLSLVETYLSSVLVATQEQERLIRLPAGQQSKLPVDTFIIATCNSYRDEPETRTRVSSPAKRRSTVITMPNVLGDRFDDDPDNAVMDLAIGLAIAETDRVAARGRAGRSAQFDALRSSSLGSVQGAGDLSPTVRAALTAVSASLLTTSVGRSWFTLGLLRDVIIGIVLADRTESAELDALGQAVADKVVHQLRGSHGDIEEFREACATLPNANEIARLLDRMMDGPSDELIPLL